MVLCVGVGLQLDLALSNEYLLQLLAALLGLEDGMIWAVECGVLFSGAGVLG